MGRTTPFVAVVSDCRVRYRGRAEAEQRGGALILLVKEDGTVCLHSLDSGIQPQFYNPSGEIEVDCEKDQITLSSVSEDGEELHVEGEVEFRREVTGVRNKERPNRTRVGGDEDDLVRWVEENPDRIGLSAGEMEAREHHQVGGRVDLLFSDVVVEVKKRAGVDVYDQVLRYLRGRGAIEAKIVCLHASRNLIGLVDQDDRLELVVVDGEEFRRFVGGSGN